MSKVRLTVWIPGTLRTLIEDEAEQREETLSEFSRKVFERFFGVQDGAKPAPKEVRREG